MVSIMAYVSINQEIKLLGSNRMNAQKDKENLDSIQVDTVIRNDLDLLEAFGEPTETAVWSLACLFEHFA